MNIFIIILVVLFMGVYYVMDSPNARNIVQETEYAIKKSDLRSITECAVAAHNATLNGYVFQDVCVEQNDIQSTVVCLNKNMSIIDCDTSASAKNVYYYVVTTTNTIENNEINNMMENLENYYADSGTFGIFTQNFILSGATSTKSIVPKGIISGLNLKSGQLVYLTQIEPVAQDTEFNAPDADDIICPAWSAKTYRFGRWQCIGYNAKTECPGDTIWDYSSKTCIPDESRKPLCENLQTAVMVDGLWECVNPFSDQKCPSNMLARLNYSTLEWECIEDTNNNKKTKKCPNIVTLATRSSIGATLRVQQTSCTDCEKMIIDEDTCTGFCVPDTEKIFDISCYPDNAETCNDEKHNIYFGFPDTNYVQNITTLTVPVPWDKSYSMNRKFNCKECTNGIDTEKSQPPYVVVCK